MCVGECGEVVKKLYWEVSVVLSRVSQMIKVGIQGGNRSYIVASICQAKNLLTKSTVVRLLVKESRASPACCSANESAPGAKWSQTRKDVNVPG